MAFTLLSLTDFALSPIAGTEYLAKSASSSGSKKSNQKLIVAGESTNCLFHPLFVALPSATQLVEIK
jgi:hypothetical protein